MSEMNISRMRRKVRARDKGSQRCISPKTAIRQLIEEYKNAVPDGRNCRGGRAARSHEGKLTIDEVG